MRRGLTLLEVIAATLLLTILSAACVTLLRQVRIDLEHSAGALRDIEPLELERLADRVLEDPAAFAIDDLASLTQATIAWPDRPHYPPVRISRLEGPRMTDPYGYATFAFTCEDLVVWRWLKIRIEERGP